MSYFDTSTYAAYKKAVTTKTLSANNASANVNIFKITGTVNISKIYGLVTAKTTLSNMTGVYFDYYDSTTATALTKNDGVMSTAIVGSFIMKTAAAATTATIFVGTTGSVSDYTYPAGAIVKEKQGANTYIRFNYTTTNTPINAVMDFFVEYESYGDGTVEAV